MDIGPKNSSTRRFLVEKKKPGGMPDHQDASARLRHRCVNEGFKKVAEYLTNTGCNLRGIILTELD